MFSVHRASDSRNVWNIVWFFLILSYAELYFFLLLKKFYYPSTYSTLFEKFPLKKTKVFVFIKWNNAKRFLHMNYFCWMAGKGTEAQDVGGSQVSAGSLRGVQPVTRVHGVHDQASEGVRGHVGREKQETGALRRCLQNITLPRIPKKRVRCL